MGAADRRAPNGIMFFGFTLNALNERLFRTLHVLVLSTSVFDPLSSDALMFYLFTLAVTAEWGGVTTLTVQAGFT